MANPIFGDDKDNTLKGGDAGDTIFGAGGKGAISGAFGNDYLSGDEGDDRLFGGENNDTLDGGNGRDVLDGGSGRDFLNAGAGSDTLKGGQGDDTVMASDIGDLDGDAIEGGDGVDTLVLSAEGSKSAIVLNAQDPLKNTSFGDSKSLTGIEQYQIFSGSGADNLTGYQLSDYFSGGSGNDTLSGAGGFDYLDGGAGTDKLYGGNGADYLVGGAGDDRLVGQNGSDLADAGAGKDTIEGGSGGDIVGGGADSDEVNGGDGDDQLYSDANGFLGLLAAEPETSTIVYSRDEGTARDTLSGAAGSDTVFMGIGDKATGSAGSGNTDRTTEVDTIHVNFVASTKAESFTFGTGSFTAKSGASWSGFEQLGFLGGSGADSVKGGSRADTLNGGAGADTMRGSDGDDVIADGTGADKLYGDDGKDSFHVSTESSGKDVFDGGAHTDTAFFGEDAEISAYLDLNDQGKNAGLIKGDSFAAIEIFVGTDLDDTMLGTGATDRFYGGGEDDVLKGNGGNDYLHGGAGSDVISSGSGTDTISLNSGEEVFGWEGDRITDFARGSDKLEVSLVEFGIGSESEFKLVVGKDPEAKADVASFVFDTETHRLWFDFDGTGNDFDPMLIATLDKVTTLSTGDFLLV